MIAPVPGVVRRRPDVVRRRGRPRPRLRRRRRAAHLRTRASRWRRSRCQPRRGRRHAEGAAAGLRQQQRPPGRLCAATRTTRSPAPMRYAEARVARPARALVDARRALRAGSTTIPTTITSCRTNPDDSGSRNYNNTSPIAGAVWHATRPISTCTSATGRASRRRRSPSSRTVRWARGSTSISTRRHRNRVRARDSSGCRSPTPALQPRRLRRADTRQEIVINTATGGRTTYANAGNTSRRGCRSGVGRRAGRRASAAHVELHVAQGGVRRRVRDRHAARRGPGGRAACPACRRSRLTAC